MRIFNEKGIQFLMYTEISKTFLWNHKGIKIEMQLYKEFDPITFTYQITSVKTGLPVYAY